MKESIIIKILYKTVVGRTILKFLVNPGVSRASARFLSSSFSGWLVPFFIRKNNINMTYYQVPEGGYNSFNDFFTRRMKEKYIWFKNGELVSPCDGLLTVSEINDDTVFHIKHTRYSLSELLNSSSLAAKYSGGTAYIFRLTPAHYHRYIWSSTGFILRKEHIDGVLHSVQPVCHEKSKVFIQNTREYAVINTNSVGKIIQMEIGALLVGKISNHNLEWNNMVCAGQEKGYFEYGGSSIVLITGSRAELAEELQYREKLGDEIPVVIGEQLTK